MGRRTLVAVVLGLSWAMIALTAVSSAPAKPYLPPGKHVFAGLTGGNSIVPYERIVRKHPAVFEDYLTYNTPSYWIGARDPTFRARLGLELSTSKGYNFPGLISPEGIALGGSDKFLVSLNRNLTRSGRIFYVRIMGEMNGWWNAYAGFSADGSSRGTRNSPHYYIEAWRRTVLILRGGTVAGINHRLRVLGLPKLKVKLPRVGRGPRRHRITRLPRPEVAFLWVPQDAGSPEIAANAPGVYWPGSAYVDWVGTDFYSSYPNFSLLDQFYAQFTGKPFVISEWGIHPTDDPGFVHELFAWVAGHTRVRMLNYYQGYGSPSSYSLSRYPASRAALRRELRSKRFLAYPPEYAHPPKHYKHHRSPPKKPPVPPQPSPGPPPPGPPPPGPTPVCLPLLNVCLPGL